MSDEIFKPVSKEEQDAVSSLPPGYKIFHNKEELHKAVYENVTIGIKTGESKLPDLTEEQLQQIVERIQAALLKQAKRSRRTGIKRPEDST